MVITSEITRILFAAERPGLRDHAIAFCSHLLPEIPVSEASLAEFADQIDLPANAGDVLILALHANEQGELATASHLIDAVMTAQAPVLVLRGREGDAVVPPRLQRIIVPLDGSTTAAQSIPVASRLARRLHLPVQFVMVIDPSRVIPPAYSYDPDAWSMVEDLRETAHWALTQSERLLELDGVQVDSSIIYGPINASLSATITASDMVIMTTHGPNRQGLRYRDSVTRRALVSIPSPMVILRADREHIRTADGYAACSWIEPLRQPGVHSD